MKRNQFYHDLYTEGVIERESLTQDEFNEDKTGAAYKMPFGAFRISDESIKKEEINLVMLLQLKKDVKVIKYVCVGFATAAAIGIIMNIVYLSRIAGAFAELM